MYKIGLALISYKPNQSSSVEIDYEIHTSLQIKEVLGVLAMSHIPDIGLAVRVFANCPGDLGSIPGRVIPKTQKMVLDASLGY